MALVTLPLLSGTASGSVGHALTFVKSPGKNIVRSSPPSQQRNTYPSIPKDGLFCCYTFALSAIVAQGRTIPGWSKCARAVFASSHGASGWFQYFMTNLFKVIPDSLSLNAFFSALQSIPSWTTYASVLPLGELHSPEYDISVKPFQLMAIQALSLYLAKPWLYGYTWPATNPTSWIEATILIFYQSQTQYA